MRRFFRQLDEGLFKAERALCLGLLGAMSLAVFLDVVHRLSSTEGPVQRLLAQAGLVSPAANIVRQLVEALISFGLVYLALRTARVARPPPPRTAALVAFVVVLALRGAVELLLVLAPNGLVWSQIFALSGMLWVGFLGASMATKERQHLTLEIMEFVWRGRAKVHVGRLGALAATVFCFLLAYLCWLHVRFHYDSWHESDGNAGVFDSFALPKFVVFSILPFSFTVMGLRFLGRVLTTETDEPLPTLEPLRPDASSSTPAEGAP